MLIIPITKKINWKHPPVINICIILITSLVYFIVQGDDEQNYMEAQKFYVASGIAAIEVDYYIEYLNKKDKVIHSPARPLTKKVLFSYLAKMSRDNEFIAKVDAYEIIQPNDPQFALWQDNRSKYKQMMTKVTSFKYGFTPANFEIPTIFSSIFLHGGTGHLIGNMIFLWIVGCILEAGCGRVIYLAAYLLTGVCASLVFKVVYWNSTIPLVGASGAIAGLMGILAVMYGKKNIKIFYSLGFFFNTIRIPALLLLLLWIVNEVIQLYLNKGSNVAYMAHIGGLLSGAPLAWILLKIPGAVDRKIFDTDPKNEIGKLIEQSLEKKAALDLNGARALLNQALEKDPSNPQALEQLLLLTLSEPNNKDRHAMAEKVISELIRSRATYTSAVLCFEAYKSTVKIIRLSSGLLIRLSLIFCELNDPQPAARLLMGILKKNNKANGLPQALLKLSISFKKNGQMENFKKCCAYIRVHFPHSQEARMISDIEK